jgi:DNA-binding NarL/FixJ family response regulator
MELARLLILAEELLLGRGLAKLLEPGFETHVLESFDRASRLAPNGRAEVALWVGDRLHAETVAGFAQVRSSHPGVLLCIVAHSADVRALHSLISERPEAVAVLQRRDGLDLQTITAMLADVLSGRSTLEPHILEQLLTTGRGEDVLAGLTPTEQQILELVAYGLRNSEIARRLWKSEKAVEKHVGHVFAKLGLAPGAQPHIDRRVTAARIFFSCRPQAVPTCVSG